MDKYFEIRPDCELYKSYFLHKEDECKIVSAYKAIREKFGIETNEFYLEKDRFRIVPTESDREKFESMMKKSKDGEFKQNSKINQMWIDLVEGIEHFDKPRLLFYFSPLGYMWKERLFNIEDKLYCSIESDVEVSTPDFAIEMKASEFFKIIEGYEKKERVNGRED